MSAFGNAQPDITAIRGTVQHIRHWNESTGFAVFTIRAEKNAKIVVSCNGVVPSPPRVGDSVEVFGYQDKKSKYPGVQYRITGFEYTKGSDVLQLARFVASFSKFLGDEKAYRIAAHFGDDLENILETEPNRLTEVEGIGPAIAQNVADGWILNKGLRSIKVFLMKLGLPDWRIREVVSNHGVGYEGKLKADPYLLMKEGVAFGACDSYAEALGITHNSPVRFKGFISHYLRNVVPGEGHMLGSVRSLVESINRHDKEHSRRRFDPVGVTEDEVLPHLDEMVKDGFVIREGGSIYHYEHFFYEAAAAQRLSDILSADMASAFKDVVFEDFVAEYEELEQLNIPDFRLADQQREALESFIKDKALIVTGAPGTGKTTVIKSFVKLLEDYDLKFLLLAPTGIAAKRLEETASHPAYTIHRKLGYKGSTWDHNSRHKLPVDVVLIDEFSMVDQQLLFRLVDALRPDTKIVLVGDVYQLPSVGAGNVLRDLIASKQIKTIFLTKVHRQAETSDIIKVANLIKDGSTDLSLFRQDPKADVVMIATGGDRDLAEQRIVEMCSTLKTRGNIRFQVISPRNEGDLSVASLNRAIQQSLNPKTSDAETEIHLDKDTRARIGDRVMIVKNNYNLGVYNGDVGKVLAIAPDAVRVQIEGLDNIVQIPTRDAPQLLKLSYCTSVHKCLPSNVRVLTPKGSLPIGSLRAGDLVLSSDGKPVEVLSADKTWHRSGVTLRTRSGRLSKSSLDHVHLIRRLGVNQWAKASDIKVGDFLVYSRESSFGGAVYSKRVSWKETRANRHKGVTVPEVLGSDFFWLLGALVGDGCYSDVSEGSISFSKSSSEEVELRVSTIAAGFGVRSTWRNRVNGKSKGLVITSIPLREYLLGAGLGFVKASEKRIPSSVWEASREERFAFLSGLLDTDGSFSPSRPLMRFSTVSPTLAEELLELMIGLGVVSYKTTVTGRYKGKPHTSYLVCVSGGSFTKMLDGVTLVNTSRVLAAASAGSPSRDIIDVVPHVTDCLKELQGAASLAKTTNGRAPRVVSSIKRATMHGNHGLSYKNLHRLAEVAESDPVAVPESLTELLRSNYFYDRVESAEVSDTTGCPYTDIEVGGDHSFLAGNQVTHNCQGQEYQVVVFALIRAHGHNLLQRNLLYTGITRAKRKVVMVGQLSAIQDAIENESIRHRNTMLGARLAECQCKRGDPEFMPMAKLLDIGEEASNYLAVRKLLFPSVPVEKSDESSYEG